MQIMKTLILFAALIGQPSKADADAQAAIAIATASQQSSPAKITQPNCGCGWGEPCRCADGCTCEPLTYDAAAQAASRYHRPLIVFVGCKVRPIAGCVVCTSPNCFNDATARVIVSTWQSGQLCWQIDMPANVSDNAVRAFIASKMTAQPTQVQHVHSERYTPIFQPIPVSFGGFMSGGGFSRGGGGGRGGSC